MQRFFFDHAPLVTGQTVDLGPLAHQLHTVLRLTSGAQVVLLDGNGCEFITQLERVERGRALGLILTQRVVSTEPAIQLTLYQCSLKADKFEWVLQKGVELGVSHFVPVISERSVVRPAAALLKKYDRWQAILREAAEQCGRARIPGLGPPLDWAAASHSASGLRLLPWEQASAGGAPGLGETVAVQPAPTPTSLLIGPEGGLTTAEVARATLAGWQVVSLGPRILRAETATLAATTIILERWGELGTRGATNQPVG
jgi:16S rRNA (uracil1498-N3)-methyltransferase